MRSISRRSFLKFSGATLLGLGLTGLRRAPASAAGAPIGYGRCLMVYVTVYSRPSIYARQVALHPLDAVLPIYESLTGEDEGAHNPRWYRTREGYVHASNVQPVKWRFNAPRYRLPPQGRLVELTVPFTTARTRPSANAPERYRLYYGSTYWAMESITDGEGTIWYALWDDRIEETYYVQAHTLRPVPASDLTPLSPGVADKWILLDVTAQSLTAYESDTPIFETLMSSGRNYAGAEGKGDLRTPLGTYYIYRKRPERHMASGDGVAAGSYDLPGVSWVAYFNYGIAFHGTYWHNDYGTPWSAGCINLLPEDARWIYRWSTPVAPADDALVEATGTRVEVI